MTLYFEEEGAVTLPLDCEKTGRVAVETALDILGCPYEAEVSLLLTTNEEIHRMNLEFRDVDRPTDVLSFPMIPFKTPADYSVIEGDDSYFDLDTDELILGDVMISVDKVYAQAEEYGHSTEREFSFLFAHSMLHLLGYDHMEPDEAAVMEAKQAKALEDLGITR